MRRTVPFRVGDVGDNPIVMIDAETKEILAEAPTPKTMQKLTGARVRVIAERYPKAPDRQRPFEHNGRFVKFTEKSRLKSFQPAPPAEYSLVEDGQVLFTGTLKECKDRQINSRNQKIYLYGKNPKREDVQPD